MATVFLLCSLLFVLVGLKMRQQQADTTENFLIAKRSVSPAAAGISMFATENSANLFIGFVGLSFMFGLPAIWAMIGWYFGEILILWLCARQFRKVGEESGAMTYSQLLGSWAGLDYKKIRLFSAVLLIVFLCIYAAAQFSAAATAINLTMQWPSFTGVFIAFLIVCSYSVIGGIRATIKTDLVQLAIITLALISMLIYSLKALGGIEGFAMQIFNIDQGMLNLNSGMMAYGFLGFMIGALFAGIGIIGQSHVMVRLLMVESDKDAVKTVFYYALTAITVGFLTVLTAVSSRALLTQAPMENPEFALYELSLMVLPDAFTGLFLAGVFAICISSADALILSSSAALTHDIFPNREKKVSTLSWTKIGAIIIAVSALAISIVSGGAVLELITFAWALMAATLGPMFILFIAGKRPTETHCLAVMTTGMVTSVAFMSFGLEEDFLNAMPGILIGLLSYYFYYPIFNKSR